MYSQVQYTEAQVGRAGELITSCSWQRQNLARESLPFKGMG